MYRHVGLFVGLLGCALAGTGLSANAQDLGRGELLYQTNCISCHESVVHVRRDRRALSPEQLKAQVTRWSRVARPEWSEGEIADVIHYLNDKYYKFPPESEEQ
jgi:mono/diheme cytochrome c family protein